MKKTGPKKSDFGNEELFLVNPFKDDVRKIIMSDIIRTLNVFTFFCADKSHWHLVSKKTLRERKNELKKLIKGINKNFERLLPHKNLSKKKDIIIFWEDNPKIFIETLETIIELLNYFLKPKYKAAEAKLKLEHLRNYWENVEKKEMPNFFLDVSKLNSKRNIALSIMAYNHGLSFTTLYRTYTLIKKNLTKSN